MIVIFPSNSTSFSTNGLGNLSDAASCLVTEERNGKFELEMTYPVDGMHYSEIGLRKLILAKPDPYSDPQPFRIYSITKPMNGIITVNAEHISYDLTGYPVKPFTATGVVQALSKISSNAIVSSPFSFYTNKTETTAFKMEQPSSIRSVLGSDKGSILGTYGGEFKFDKYSVRLLASRGSNNGVTIRYGKNLTDLNQEEIGSNVYSAVYPFWYSDGTLVELSPKTIAISGVTGYTRIFSLDLTRSFSSAPSVSELRAAANAYISENDLGSPEINLELEFIELNQVVGYEDFAALESVQLCDIVTVIYPLLGISAVAKCITTVYDVISGKYQSVELGTKKSDLSNTVSNLSSETNSVASAAKTALSNTEKVTALFLASLGSGSGGGITGDTIINGTYTASGSDPLTISLTIVPSIVVTARKNELIVNSHIFSYMLGYLDGESAQLKLAKDSSGNYVLTYQSNGANNGTTVTNIYINGHTYTADSIKQWLVYYWETSDIYEAESVETSTGVYSVTSFPGGTSNEVRINSNIMTVYGTMNVPSESSQSSVTLHGSFTASILSADDPTNPSANASAYFDVYDYSATQNNRSYNYCAIGD